MSARVLLEGLDELRDELQRLPADLNREARDQVIATAQATAAELRAAYPEKTGNLRRGVKVTIEETPTSTIAKVISSAPHAHLWEFGTENRKTQKLWKRGRMPAKFDQGLVGIAIRRRLRMERLLVAIVEHHHFQVTR
jgi:HK97 gp10 family phage protein